MSQGNLKKSYLLSVILILATVALSTNAIAGAAKGKPFVALEGQIVQVQGAVLNLQDQVNDLVGQVDSLEGRVTASELAIIDLRDQNNALDLLIVNAYTSVEDLYAEIDILSADVIGNETLISTLQSTVATIEQGQIDLQGNLQDQIDNNTTLIDALLDDIETINAKLELKQNLVNGVCAEGEAIQQVQDDGSVVCGGTSGGGSGQLETIAIYASSGYIGPGQTSYKFLSCPEGFLVTGAGYNDADGFEVRGSAVRALYLGGGIFENKAMVGVQNNQSYQDYFFIYAACARIAP